MNITKAIDHNPLSKIKSHESTLKQMNNIFWERNGSFYSRMPTNKYKNGIRKSSMDLKLMGIKSDEKQDIYIVSKDMYKNYLLLTKEK